MTFSTPFLVPDSNLIALGFLIKYQKYLSLRVLVLQPLVITLIMLVSTAALVRDVHRLLHSPLSSRNAPP